MSLKGMITLLVAALVALQAGCCACAPAPVISSVTISQGKESLKSLPLIGGAQVNLASKDAPQPHASANANASGSPNAIKQQQQQIIKANNAADKLKRGLSNFMNQLNPASFFVPTAVQQPNVQQQQQQQQAAVKGELAKQLSSGKASSQTSAETAAIVNGDPTADVLIKGPNRLSQTRPIGGPLRWG